MTNDVHPYGQWHKIYRDLGYWPRPLKFPGTFKGKPCGKMCLEQKWQTPDPGLDPVIFDHWGEQLSHFNIGLVMGSPLPGNTKLVALDIDDDRLTAVGKSLARGVISGRVGKKGIVIFCRAQLTVGNAKFRNKGFDDLGNSQIAELLADRSLCVIPPSVHPETNAPYRWVGQALHEIDPLNLPLIGD